MISTVWLLLISISVIFGFLTGRLPQVTLAVTDGAGAAVNLCISVAGAICLWSGLMEIMTQSGLTVKISRLLMPLLKPLFKPISHDRKAMETIAANFTANLLGLGNAATPMGLRAATLIQKHSTDQKCASDSLIRLIVINTSSVQIIPTTIASIRNVYGAVSPYGIMPAVWCASIASFVTVIMCTSLMKIIDNNCDNL